jgi:hypothetical protein
MYILAKKEGIFNLYEIQKINHKEAFIGLDV